MTWPEASRWTTYAVPCSALHGQPAAPVRRDRVVAPRAGRPGRRRGATTVRAAQVGRSPRAAPVGAPAHGERRRRSPARGSEGDGSGCVGGGVGGARTATSSAGATGPVGAGVADGVQADRHRDREHDRRDHPADGPPATLDAAGAALHVGQADRCAVHVLGPLAQAAGETVLVVGAHRSSSRAVPRLIPGWSWTRDRIAASARLAWDLTVPTEMPSTSAVSASVRSS